jgi:superfamily II DNA or RNA helicase
VNVEIISALECKTDKKFADIIEPHLSYTAAFYQQTMFRKVRKEYTKSTMYKDKKGGYFFYTGFLPRIVDLCASKAIWLEITGEITKWKTKAPSVPGITLRADQTKLIDKFLALQRGVIKAPTGVGKTIVGIAIISALPSDLKVLWLCHTKDLMHQAGDRMIEVFPGQVGKLGDAEKDLSKRILVATRQSFSKIATEIGHEFDVVVIDEAHHVTSFDGEYGEILKAVLAEVRLGLTATLPEEQSARLAVEGLIGNVVGEITINEGAALGIMAKPRIKFIKVPKSHAIKELRVYSDVYQEAVVEREERHRLIANIVETHAKDRETVLVLVNRLEHGANLERLFRSKKFKSVFIHGGTSSEDRMLMKEALNNKKMDAVICTTIWKEGVDIPELNVVINAGGGKSEVATLQAIGRGLRLTKTKKELIIYDLMDLSHRYLVEHLAERLGLYSQNDWI